MNFVLRPNLLQRNRPDHLMGKLQIVDCITVGFDISTPDFQQFFFDNKLSGVMLAYHTFPCRDDKR